MSSADRLNRILGMIPYLLQHQGVSLMELSEEFQVRPAELLRDLQALSNCSYGPFGSAEVMDAYIEEDRVHIWAGEHFKRPLSFTPGELMALRTAVSLMLEHTDAKETRALARAHRTITGIQDGRGVWADAFKGKIGVEPPPALSAEIFSTFERGVHESRKVSIRYFTEQRSSISERMISPYKMVNSDGQWYVVGFCERAGGIRTFRVDHVRSAELGGEHFEVPDSFRLEDHFVHGVYVETETEERIVIRYLAPAARLVVEEEGRGRLGKDGSVILSYHTSSPRWLLQRVLSYGEAAEIIEPLQFRQSLVELLAMMAQSYKE
ncbi:helix-turn-helix transcriptional regulator [Gemmatimonadota bacterium]